MKAQHDERMARCPFCGALDGHVVDSKMGTFASCRQCHATGPTKGNVETAIDHWNSRDQRAPAGKK